MRRPFALGLAGTLILAAESRSALEQGTAFTNQGQLKNAASNVTTPTDVQFSLWTAATGGTQFG